MDGNETSIKKVGRTRRVVASIALVAAGLVAGGVLFGSQLAQAAGGSGTGSNGSDVPVTAPADMAHGPGETLLTGSIAEKVKAAALDAVPNATVIRVETDSDGSAYEAHLQKADGSYVTVKVDASFDVTDTIDGFGGGPGMPAAPSTGSNA